jgi:hypothetical protein
MNDENDDERDGELRHWLQDWPAPQPSPGLRRRVAASYGRAIRNSWWRRLWGVRLSVPLPVVLACVVLLIVTAGLGWRGKQRASPGESGESVASGLGGLADLRPLPEIQMRVVRREK